MSKQDYLVRKPTDTFSMPMRLDDSSYSYLKTFTEEDAEKFINEMET